jgi:DNA-binding transcriptional ArsR family regulator
MLASNIEIHYTEYDLHAKLIITEKYLVVSSVNLNKMNLGFNKTKKYWRENTETLTVCTDKELIRTAKEQYLNIFQNSIDVRYKLEEKAELEIKDAIKLFLDKELDSRVNLRLSRKAKEMLSKQIVEKQIEVERDIYSIARIVNSIIRIYNKKKTDDIVIYALILHSLLEKNLTFTQLDQSLKSLNIIINLNPLLTDLVSKNLVDKEGDLYKINRNNL